MLGYTRKNLKTGSLKLDPRNPRIPQEVRGLGEKQILHWLLENEDVKSMARLIAQDGLHPHESYIVMKDNRRYIVLEGNRRLSAVKLILNPELAPIKQDVAMFNKLRKIANLKSLANAEVVVYPDRLSAAGVLAAIHTKEPKRRWSQISQAAFYAELTAEGSSPTDIASIVGRSQSEITSFLRLDKLFKLTFKAVQDHRELDNFVKGKSFPSSILERLLNSKAGRNAMGLEISSDEPLLLATLDFPTFQNRLTYMLSGMLTGSVSSRSLNTERDIETYAKTVVNIYPETGGTKPYSVEDLTETTTTEPAVPKNEAPVTSRRQLKKSNSIIPNSFKVGDIDGRIHDLFLELKTLKIAQYPNAIAMLLRVLLELSVWEYVKKSGDANTIISTYDPKQAKRGHNPNWIPPFSNILSSVLDNNYLVGLSSDENKAARTLLAKDNQQFLTIEGFNSFVHNSQMIPTEKELQALWIRVKPLLQITLK